jgi:hypothetical protein
MRAGNSPTDECSHDYASYKNTRVSAGIRFLLRGRRSSARRRGCGRRYGGGACRHDWLRPRQRRFLTLRILTSLIVLTRTGICLHTVYLFKNNAPGARPYHISLAGEHNAPTSSSTASALLPVTPILSRMSVWPGKVLQRTILSTNRAVFSRFERVVSAVTG